MKKDAHYYAILGFCRACGFKKKSAQAVAYASQFVDDAKVNLMYIKNPSEELQCEIVDHRPAFFNMATCHSYFKIKTFNYEAMVNNTVAFHFVPGCKGENFTKKLRCMEESPVIMKLLHEVLLEDDLVKLGIVLHAYADTFAHQGFSGLLSKVNDIKNYKAKAYIGLLNRATHKIKQFTKDNYDGLFDYILPAYGHGQALDFPDLPYLVWSYDYEYSDEFNGNLKRVEIDNRERYKRAFRKIQAHLEKYLLHHPQHLDPHVKFDKFDLLLETLVYEATDTMRNKKWLDTLIDEKLITKDDLEFMIYKNDKWLKEAFVNYNPFTFTSRHVNDVQLIEDFILTPWYQFYLDVKWYKKRFYEICSSYQLDIPH